MRRAWTALAAAAVVAAGLLGIRVRADVSAAADWRLTGGIATVTPAGPLLYVGGTFTELFTPSSVEPQFYDLVTGQVRSDCARSTDPQRSLFGYTDLRGGLLVPLDGSEAFADQLGAFAPPPGSTMARIGDNCLWDRQFAGEAINPLDPSDLTIGVPVRVGNLIFASNAIFGSDLKLRAQVASFSADSGRRTASAEYRDKSEIGMLGAAPTRAIVRVRTASDPTYVLGAIDPATLALTESTTVLTDESNGVRSWVRGNRLYRYLPAPASLLEAYDLSTLQPLAGWTAPVIPALLDLEVVGSRVFVTATVVNGRTVAAPAALVAATGAVDASWAPPALTRKLPLPGGQTYEPTLTALAIDGARLYFSGDFERVGGLDRGGQAALIVSSGTLDSWDTAPWVVSPVETTSTALLTTRPAALNRTTRRYLAAIDRATGVPTAWDPNDQSRTLQHTPTPVAAIAVDATHVYFASGTSGEVRRADVTTADVDQTWRLLVTRDDGSPGAVTTMAIAGGVVYLGGQFDRISGTTVPATRRRALAAVGADGGLRAWAPTVDGPSGTTLVRAMLHVNGTIFLGGDFTEVNDQLRLGFAAVDTGAGALAQPELFVLGDTSIYGLATDGVQVFIAGTSFGAPLVGAVSVPDSGLTPFRPAITVPRGAAYVAGRLYAGVEFDVDATTPTSRQTAWGRVAGDDAGLVHLLDDGTIEYFVALPGTPPGAPTLSANSAANLVTATWTPDPAGGAPTSYTLYAGSAPGTRDLAAIVLRGTTSFSVNAPTGLYYLSLSARNAHGTSALSNEVAVQAGCIQAPTAPSPLSYTSAGNSLTLWWAASQTATNYTLEAGLSPGGSQLGAVPLGNVQSLAAAAPLGTYYVRARASNACGTSGVSNEVAIVLNGAVVAPQPPTGFVWVMNGRTLAMAWTPPKTGGMATSYVLEAGLAPGGTIAVVPTSAPGLVVPNAPAGTYYVRVRAANPAGQSAATAEATVLVP